MRVKTFIHVNTHTIRQNRKTGAREPPIAVRRNRSGKAVYVDHVDLEKARLVYNPDHPLPSGAVVWIEIDC